MTGQVVARTVARTTLAIVLAVSTAACAEQEVERRVMPGAAFGPDFEAMRRHTLQPIRLRQRRPSAPKVAGRIAPARQTAAAPQTIEAAFPTVLNKVDTQLYLRAFAAQRRRDWKQADRFLAAVTDKRLIGSLLAQRYLGTYDASFTELSDWLEKYGDHHGADRLYRLAQRRKPAGAAMPPRTKSRPLRALPFPAAEDRSPDLPAPPRLSADDRAAASTVRRAITGAMSGGRYSRAAELLDANATRLLGAARADALRARLGHLLLQRGRFRAALRVTAGASRRSWRYVSLAPWIAGLSAWSLSEWKEAADHFERLANARNDHRWLIAGSAYWAGRSHASAGDAPSANHWFGRAAVYNYTFYGLLARRRLGLPSAFDWRPPVADPEPFRRIVRSDRGKRIIALVQIGAYTEAGDRLLRWYFEQAEEDAETFLAIALAARMPSAAYQIAIRLARRDGRRFDVALFPTPIWRPVGRNQVDRAVVYAVMRQESLYQPAAKSHAGARGLMQIMPGTARFTARQISLRFRHDWELFNPSINLRLGESFLRYLFARPAIDRNLAFTFAAYNAGEGNLARWRVRKDPLLFTEAIHFRETRIYVERVLFNLWAYRARLGQAAPSLKALAADRWPLYVPLDPSPER